MDTHEQYDKITEIFADNLSDIPSEDEDVNIHEDDFDSECSRSDSETVRSAKKHKLVISSVSSSDKVNNSSNEITGDLTFCCDNDNWSTVDILPNLEKFKGNWGVTVIPSEPDSIIAVTNIIFGDDLFAMFCNQLSVYYNQTSGKHKVVNKVLKWSSVTPTEMRKFLGLILLMGHTRKDNWKEYWSTDPLLAIPIFPQTMSRNRFQQIWTFWHFNDNEKMDKSSSRLFKIQPVLEYFVNKFKTVYKPKQQLSLEEGMITWSGRLKFRNYKPCKIVKCGLLVRMVRESDTGYICNMEIYSDERKSLDETVLSILGPNLELWHHVYQDNYYNSVLIANTLLEHKTRVCGTIRVNRGLPQSLQDEASTLKKGEIVFRRKGDILLLIWKDAREVRMISTIHDASFCSTGRKNRDSGEEIIKPMCIVQYNAYMKGLDLADQYFSYCNILRKSAKWTKNVVLYLINCGLFNSFKIFQTLNPQSKIKYKQFLLVVARDWITPKGTEESIDLESNISGPSNIGSKRPPCKDHPQRLSEYALPMEKEVKHATSASSVLFRFI
ncbi:piggyBac transposable element-derived protein 4 isoform X2 [Ptiloglossa arizonensis]|uniref:piggyBac transposable element-derived protein 4 isoform X2 n=1 Tax=Ptiloglossa arizonensis TaxID=3350558 RepID=UPI003FA0E16A